ncbi:MAG: hypothetical protein IPK76_02695 [Lewinellaceae bacterium]|nr:hypothetical protein [Lewinellaceae bacterium]
MPKYLIIAGSLILLTLGLIHLLYTFFTNKFLTHNPETAENMKRDFPLITKETTMWKAWIGFNASHSLGAIFFGTINIYLAVNYFSIIQHDFFFSVFNLFTVGFYLWLSKKYWFRVPFIGILLTTFCFVLVLVLKLSNPEIEFYNTTIQSIG